MINVYAPKVIPFKLQINSFEWTSFFKDFAGLRYRIENQILVLEETEEGGLQTLEDLFTKLRIEFTSESSPKQLRLAKLLTLPRVTKDLFFQLLVQYYTYNTKSELSSYRSFVTSLTTAMISHVRIVSALNDPLRKLVENLQQETSFEEVQSLFDSFLNQEEWSKLFDNPKFSHYLISVPINTWLHILRHPSEAKDNLIKFLRYLSTSSVQFPYIFTDIPLVDPKGFYMLAVTNIDASIFEDQAEDDDNSALAEITSYWLTFGSLVLRNICYGIIRFNNLSLEGFTHEDISFYEYFKPKLNQFSESCFNPDLVDAFRAYDDPKNKKRSTIRGHDLYTYNRSVILEYHLKQAQQEFNRFPQKKILRKRVNRRSKRLYAFLNDVIYIYRDYLNEISSLTKASGNYTSIEKIFRFNN